MPHEKINSKYCLTTSPDGSQNPDVAAKSATGRENPSMLSATTDAPCVFYVAINATERHIMAWCVHSGHSIAGHEQVAHHSAMSMVAQAGQLSGWPVSDNAGILTPSGLSPLSVRTPAIAYLALLSEVALWLRPQSLYTLNLSGSFLLSAVLTCWRSRSVRKSLPLISQAHAAL